MNGSGILVTQRELGVGWHSMRYYEADRSGRTKELTYEPSTIHDSAANRRDQRRIAWFARDGEMSAQDLPCKITFMQFYVGTPANLLARTPEQAVAKEEEVKMAVRQHRICR